MRTQARIWILTGPNRGGKTTFTQSVGLIHILFQAGLYVPAAEARISPVDAIYTHFPVPETTQLGMGRLDEEAKRLAGIFAAATPQSLILLNEVLARHQRGGRAGPRHRRRAPACACSVSGRSMQRTCTTWPSGVDQINQTTPGTAKAGSLVADVEAQGAVVGSHHRRDLSHPAWPAARRQLRLRDRRAERHQLRADLGAAAETGRGGVSARR